MLIKHITEFNNWDNMVLDSCNGTIFQTSWWLNNSTKDFIILGVYLEKILICGCVFQFNIGTKKGSLGSLSPYLGFVFSNDFYKLSHKKQINIKNKFINYINETFKKVTFFTSSSFEDMDFIVKNGYDAKLNYTHLLLIDNIEKIFNNFSPNLRSNIRSAIKNDLVVKEEKNIDNLINLVRKTFYRQNENIWFDLKEARNCMEEIFKVNRGNIFTTYNKNNFPIASLGFVWDNKTAYYILGGYDFDISHRGGSSLAMYHAIMFFDKIGIKTLDLEGSRHKRIDKFFSQFNGKIKPFYQVLEYYNSLTEV